MQNPIFSESKLKDWIATLVALFVITIFLVLNLPHLAILVPPVKVWNDRMWSILYRILIVKMGIRAIFLLVKEKLQRPGDVPTSQDNVSEEEEGIEMEERMAPEQQEPRTAATGEPGEVV